MAAVFAAGLYVLWGPMAERKRRRKGEGRPPGTAARWELKRLPANNIQARKAPGTHVHPGAAGILFFRWIKKRSGRASYKANPRR